MNWINSVIDTRIHLAQLIRQIDLILIREALYFIVPHFWGRNLGHNWPIFKRT